MLNYHNVRDSKGRFTKATQASSTTLNMVNPIKEDYLDTLRNNEVEVTHEKNGLAYLNLVTLKPNYLTTYVGKGKSKNTNSNIIFAYELNQKRFISIDINTITQFEIMV